jgi:DNA-directed RNA polymerase I, II, and III subunit RPABC5
MIVPVRCFQCGKVLAHMWEPYQKRVDELKITQPTVPFSLVQDVTTMVANQEKTPEAQALDELNINRYCCRSVMLGTVDLTDKI